MWLSKQINTQIKGTAAQSAVVISGGNNAEAASNFNVKGFESYAPFGYIYSAPPGAQILLIDGENGPVNVGVKAESESKIQCGEIIIRSLGGAEIYLKNNGSVVINGGFVINGDGSAADEKGNAVV